MAEPPAEQFGKRRLPPLESSPPVKRSGRVALLVMGTLAVGGGAYLLMPHDNCEPNRRRRRGVRNTRPDRNGLQFGFDRSGWSSRSSYYGGSDSSSSHSSSESGSGSVTRGGFGGFAHAISAHFSGG